MRKPRTWSYRVGERRDRAGGGVTVRVYEKAPGGALYLATFDPEMHEGRGGYRRLSLGHNDKAKARARADEVHAALKSGRAMKREPGAPTLGQVVALYLAHEADHFKPGTKRWLPRALESWVNMFGTDTLAEELGAFEWAEYVRKRGHGEVDGHGRPVPPGERRPVKPGTVCACLDAIMAAFNWATTYRIDNRQRLLRESPFFGLEYPDNPNVERAVWTHDRFAKVLAAAEQLTMQVEWDGHRQRVACYLADVLFVAAESGRRIGAVRQLRAGDVRLSETTPGALFGRIVWPADTDKKGKEWSAPITRDLRERLVRILGERGALSGDAYLFPSPRNAGLAVGRETLALFLRRAEKLAGVQRLAHDSFHGLRRKWASERRHLPEKDVAAAGGWRSPGVMKRAYQQADDAGVLEAVINPRRLTESLSAARQG